MKFSKVLNFKYWNWVDFNRISKALKCIRFYAQNKALLNRGEERRVEEKKQYSQRRQTTTTTTLKKLLQYIYEQHKWMISSLFKLKKKKMCESNKFLEANNSELFDTNIWL